MEVLAKRGATRAPTAAVCLRHKLLAVAAAARDDGDRSSGGASRVEILRVWRVEDEPKLQRGLQRVATIPCEADYFHSIAWSRSPSGTYPLGLLATGLDGGVVRVWATCQSLPNSFMF